LEVLQIPPAAVKSVHSTATSLTCVTLWPWCVWGGSAAQAHSGNDWAQADSQAATVAFIVLVMPSVLPSAP
jgi:hypothetical protein